MDGKDKRLFQGIRGSPGFTDRWNHCNSGYPFPGRSL